MELDWVQMNGEKGTLILKDNGIYFQPYVLKKPEYSLGDAVSTGQTGVFGAFNLYKKLSNTKSLPEVARDIRKEKGIKELVKAAEITYIPWHKIKSVKKKLLSGNIIIQTKHESKIKIGISEIEKKEKVTVFLLDNIASMSKGKERK